MKSKSVVIKLFLILFFIMICSSSCAQKNESMLTEVCKEAYEILTKEDRPDLNDYMENCELLIRDYPKLSSVILQKNSDNGVFGKVMSLGALSSMGKAYALYELNMSEEEFKKVVIKN